VRTINFYRTTTGDCPVEEFLDSLSSKQAQKVAWVLRLIEELELVPSQYFEKLVNTEDIWEVRVQFGGDIFRLLGFFASSSVLILTNGFAKKSQKTPRQEIELATRRKNEFLSRQRKK
jgi:phage-related protein